MILPPTQSPRLRACLGPGPRRCASLVLVGLAVLLVPGCLINAPQELEAKERVSPQILSHTAVPTNLEYYSTDTSISETTFTVRYTSEDLGLPVTGILYLNWEYGPPESVGHEETSPQSLDEEPNEMRIEWPHSLRRDLDPGCYTLTMAITPSDNIQTGLVNLPIDLNKTDFITWWIAHDLPPQEISLADCPRPGDPGTFP